MASFNGYVMQYKFLFHTKQNGFFWESLCRCLRRCFVEMFVDLPVSRSILLDAVAVSVLVEHVLT